MRSSFKALMIVGSVTGCAVLVYFGLMISQNRNVRSVAERACQNGIFTSIDQSLWAEIKDAAAAASATDQKVTLVEYDQPVWREVDGRPGFYTSRTILKVDNKPAALMQDIAYSKRSVWSDLQLLPSAEPVTCSWQLYQRGSIFAKIVYDFGKVNTRKDQ